MSAYPLHCKTCDRECAYDRCSPFGQGQESMYAVAWRCPDGHGLSLDVCPVGPLVPAPGLCLNCGAAYSENTSDARCAACGLSRQACPAALGFPTTPDDPIASAREFMGHGLFRRAIGILNHALQERAELVEAWFLKSRFLNSVGFNRTAAEMLQDALMKFPNASDRIWLLEEQSFLWAECEHGEKSLPCADAAIGLGSDSVRTHYLSGRALALVGRLAEAREEMKKVLALDPENADANRGIKMIEVALKPNPAKRWWQFWKQ